MWRELNKLYWQLRDAEFVAPGARVAARFLPGGRDRQPARSRGVRRHADARRGLAVHPARQVPRAGRQDAAHPRRQVPPAAGARPTRPTCRCRTCTGRRAAELPGLRGLSAAATSAASSRSGSSSSCCCTRRSRARCASAWRRRRRRSAAIDRAATPARGLEPGRSSARAVLWPTCAIAEPRSDPGRRPARRSSSERARQRCSSRSSRAVAGALLAAANDMGEAPGSP